MKLKYKIPLFPCLSSMVLMTGFSVLVMLYASFIRNGMTVEDALNHLLFGSLILGTLVLLITTFLAWRVSQKLTVSLLNISTIAWEIANGDLSKAVEMVDVLLLQEERGSELSGDDETGRLQTAIATMTDNLNSLVGQVQRSGMQVASSSSELFSASKQQETMVNTQMDSMIKVRHSVEEISTIAAHLVNTMNQVATVSQETAEFASSGQTDLIRMKEAMYRMDEASQLISDRLGTIHEKADNITMVVTTITKVAEKTNLLSLNAAIEAEKAGEYGHGFTVIAREIRRLADQTALSTFDIDRMVNEMQSAVTSGVMEMDKFIAHVRRGVEDVGRISSQLTRIISQVQALSPEFEEVNVAVGQQSQNAQKINAEILSLSDDMLHTIETLQESYGSIEHLNAAVQDLQQEVSRFQVSRSILREIEMFTPFSEEAVSYLNEHMTGEHFSPGEDIVRQGELTDSLYIVAKGVVGVYVKVQDGKTLEVTRRGAGNIFGEISLLTGKPRTATVTAITDSYLFEIKKDDIAPFIAKEPEIAERLSAILTQRSTETEAKKRLYALQRGEKEAIYSQTLQQIQQFFGLEKE